jgi:hypothetical protein
LPVIQEAVRAARPAAVGVALPAVGGVGAFAVGGGGRVVAFQVQGLGEPFERLAGLAALGEGALERAAGGGGVAVAQRRVAFLDRGRAHRPMISRAVGAWSGARPAPRRGSATTATPA